MRISIFIFPIVLVIVFFSIKFTLPDTYKALIQEDTWLEYLQALFYFLAAIFAFLSTILFFKNNMFIHAVLYSLLAVGLLFIAIEEISWGQRIFNIESSDYFLEHNKQEEITIHNLKPIQSILHDIYIAVGFYGAFSWFLLFLIRLRKEVKLNNVLNFIVPSWFISSYFFFTMFMYIVLEYVRPIFKVPSLVARDQEPIELILSVGFLIFCVINYKKLKAYLKLQNE